MQNLLRRGGVYYARLFIPADRWADVGKARGAKGCITRKVVRSLQTGNVKEARRRLRPALAAMQAEVDAKLIAAGRRPLTEWSASWVAHALTLRKALQLAGDKALQGVWEHDSSGEEVFVEDTERDLLLDAVGEEAERLAARQGDAVAASFRKAVTTDMKLKLPRFRGVVRDLVISVLRLLPPVLLRRPWATDSRVRSAALPGCTTPR